MLKNGGQGKRQLKQSEEQRQKISKERRIVDFNTVRVLFSQDFLGHLIYMCR